MKVLVAGPVAGERLAAVMACEAGRAERLTADLVDEGLVVRTGLALRLP
jgi:hypothetical protein